MKQCACHLRCEGVRSAHGSINFAPLHMPKRMNLTSARTPALNLYPGVLQLFVYMSFCSLLICTTGFNRPINHRGKNL